MISACLKPWFVASSSVPLWKAWHVIMISNKSCKTYRYKTGFHLCNVKKEKVQAEWSIIPSSSTLQRPVVHLIPPCTKNKDCHVSPNKDCLKFPRKKKSRLKSRNCLFFILSLRRYKTKNLGAVAFNCLVFLPDRLKDEINKWSGWGFVFKWEWMYEFPVQAE